MKPKPFATEADLCASFISAVGRDWTPYAETAGWDILLVRNADGFQIGIEAKLKLNAHVISQALEEYGAWCADRPGPDCRAVLVPHGEANHFERIAAFIGLTIITVSPPTTYNNWARFWPSLPAETTPWNGDKWQEWAPTTRHKLPEYVPDVAAGASAPTRLTAWKIAAIKIAVTLEQRGYLTRADFKHIGIDHRRWVAAEAGWLRVQNGRFFPGDRMPDFRAQHPKVYEQIAADVPKWMTPKALLTESAA